MMTLLKPLILFLSLSAPASPPSVVHSTEPTLPPVWVALQEAVSETGEIRWDVLGTRALRSYKGVLRNLPLELYGATEPPPEQERYDLSSSGKLPQCVYYGPSFRHYPAAPRESVRDLALSSRFALRGRVVEITPGFFDGEPFSLLTVRVDRVVRGEPPQRSPLLYVLYPYAQFTAGNVSFCKDDLRFPHIPRVGDTLILFAPRGTVGLEERLYVPDENYVIFSTPDDRLVLPRGLASQDRDLRSLDEIEQRVKRAAPGDRR